MQAVVRNTETDHIAEADRLVGELLMTPEGRMDPYPRYHRLRAIAPVHRSQLGGMWVVSSYRQCELLLDDARLSKDYERQNDSRIGPHWRDHISLTDGARSMVNLDGAAHSRLRGLVAKAFTRRTVEAMRPAIAEITEELLVPLAASGGGEALSALSFPLALRVIGEMLGVPREEQAQFPAIVRDILVVFETLPGPEQLATADQAQQRFRDYFQRLVVEKRRRPGADLLSTLISMEVDGDRLSDEEVWMLGTLLFGAGFETTANQLGNGILALIRHPAEQQRLRADDAAYRVLPDELLRYDGTAHMTVRVASVDLDVDGQRVAAGDTLLLLLAAGNRDPDRYPDPDRFDLTRSNLRPLSFGGGVHYCLGAALARVELEVVFRTLLTRFKHLALKSDPVFRDRITLRGLESLHIACS
jgi:cytochrome P450